MIDRDFIYFARRATEEREAALNAPTPAAAWTHRELARKYEALARMRAPGASL